MPHIQTQTEWEETMARRVMEQVRAELYLDQRYLNAALGALPPAPREGLPAFATDGAALYYPVGWVLATYRSNRWYLGRAWLHSLLHCVFRHPWLRDKRDPALWGLACDIAVEQVLDTLHTPATTRPVGWLRQHLYARIKSQCKLPGAGRSTACCVGWMVSSWKNTAGNLPVTATASGRRTPTALPPGCADSSGNKWAARPS